MSHSKSQVQIYLEKQAYLAWEEAGRPYNNQNHYWELTLQKFKIQFGWYFYW